MFINTYFKVVNMTKRKKPPEAKVYPMESDELLGKTFTTCIEGNEFELLCERNRGTPFIKSFEFLKVAERLSKILTFK